MALRAIFVVLLTVTGFVLLGSTLVGPLTTVSNDINATGDYSDMPGGHDGNAIITGLVDDWFNMILIGIFGVMAWATWFVVRRELTRGQL